MKKSSIAAQITATKHEKNVSDGVPVICSYLLRYCIKRDGTICRKMDIEIDEGMVKKRQTGCWTIWCKLQRYILENTEELEQILHVWKNKFEQADYDVEVEICE